MCWSPPIILMTLSPPTYWQTEICAGMKEEFQQFYIRVNAYHKNKTTIKSNSNLTNLSVMHFKNIQCTIIKKGTVSVVYVED